MTYVIKHMNDHHESDMIGLIKKFAKQDAVQAQLLEVDLDGLLIEFSTATEAGLKHRINFPQKTTREGLKDAIIDLCTKAPNSGKNLDINKLKEEIKEFQNSFTSAVLATVDGSNFPHASYAPLLNHDGKIYIYISSIAEHHANIKANPTKISLLYLEDSVHAKSIILRKRLYFSAKAKEISRDSSLFDAVISQYKNSSDSSLKTIANFADFALFELQIGSGRFVKGFGQAYDISESGDIGHIGGGASNPHAKNPHNPHGRPHS
ncbi:MAG: pyridoxamine 5'-phosphate oxidase family protein [Helicobacter sp.]|nr:pyridoxamine 5'-phosphate oxidase family protein [Helicobacter sp.]